MLDTMITNAAMRDENTFFPDWVFTMQENKTKTKQGIYSISVFMVQVKKVLVIQVHTLAKPSLALSHLKNSYIKNKYQFKI